MTLVATLCAGASSRANAQRLDTADEPAGADHSALRVQAVRIAEGSGLEIDGQLDEPAWSRATAVTGFVQMRPDPGESASARSEAMILFDDDAIYVGMRLFDDPDSVAAQLARRDASGVFADWAHVLIDSYHDRRTAFRFSITPAGAKKDVLHFNDGQEDVNWDAVWDGASALQEDGWSAEFRIPLSQLRFSDQDGESLVWGINFGREIARLGEWAWWSPVLPSVGGIVSQAGELHGVSTPNPPRRIEVVPYTLGRLIAAPDDPGNPFFERRDGAADIGADVKVGVSSNLTLSATINPDFGQVEADPSVVNLSAFETFYPEKRPFFTEGANIFGFGIGTDDNSGETLFYSRRIGRAPQRSVSVSDGWTDAPDVTTIRAAAKLSGRLSSGWTIGVLDAVTTEEEARLARPGEATWTEPIEPRANYAAVALSKDFREGRSSVGILGTSVHRDLGDERFEFLRSSAYALGLTATHRFAADRWQASGYIAGSHVRGSEDAILRLQRSAGHYYQRPDADHIEVDPSRTSLSGAVANLWVGTFGGGHWRGGFGGHLRTPGFEVNDLGFQQAADQALAFASVNYTQFEPRGMFRSFNINLNPSIGWTFGGERMWGQLGTSANFELTSFWNGGYWIARRFESLGPGRLRGGPAVTIPAAWRYSTWINSDRRNVVTASLSSFGGREDESGAWDVTLAPTINVRPSASFNLSVGTSWRRGVSTWQYVGAPNVDGEPRYIVGQLDQTTVSLTTRFAYIASPTLSFEVYAQPFISGGDYERFRTLADGRADGFDQRFPLLEGSAIAYNEETNRYSADTDFNGSLETSFANPDFGFRQMRGNAVLRWEYRPGSTLYLVWGQSRTGSVVGRAEPAFDLGRDADRLFNGDDAFPTPVTNVFIVKLSYWINP